MDRLISLSGGFDLFGGVLIRRKLTGIRYGSFFAGRVTGCGTGAVDWARRKLLSKIQEHARVMEFC